MSRKSISQQILGYCLVGSRHPFLILESQSNPLNLSLLNCTLENPGKHVDLGSTGSGGSFLVKRIARKLRRIILLHFGLVTFRFHYWKTLKSLIFMISGFLGVTMCSKTNIVYLWRHQDTPNNSRKYRRIDGNILFLEISKLWNTKSLEVVEKTRTEQFRRSV